MLALDGGHDAGPLFNQSIKRPAKKNLYRTGWDRRAAEERRATPPWVDLKEIEAIYEEARRMTRESGIKHEVDHFYPINHTEFCGLHCPANLRIVTAEINRSKSNYHPDRTQGDLFHEFAGH